MRAHAASQLCSLRNNNTAFAEAQTRSGFFPLSRFLLHNLERSRSACSVAVSYKPPMLVTRVRIPACALLCLPARSATPCFDSRLLNGRVARQQPKHANSPQRLTFDSLELASGELIPGGVFSEAAHVVAEVIIQAQQKQM